MQFKLINCPLDGIKSFQSYKVSRVTPFAHVIPQALADMQWTPIPVPRSVKRDVFNFPSSLRRPRIEACLTALYANTEREIPVIRGVVLASSVHPKHAWDNGVKVPLVLNYNWDVDVVYICLNLSQFQPYLFHNVRALRSAVRFSLHRSLVDLLIQPLWSSHERWCTSEMESGGGPKFDHLRWFSNVLWCSWMFK